MLPTRIRNRAVAPRTCRRILPFAESSQPSTTFCWSASDRPLPGESLWSLLHRFCARNALSGCEAIQSLTGRSKSTVTELKKIAQTDFRIELANTWVVRLGEATRSTPTELRIGTVQGLLGDLAGFAEPDIIATEVLRFCPECIRHGHHSIAHQVCLEAKCYIHECALRDRCPNCSSRIPFRMPKTFENSYSCPTCSVNLWNRRSVLLDACPTAKDAAAAGLSRLLERIKGWTDQGLRMGTPPRFSFGQTMERDTWIAAHGPKMQDYLETVVSAEGHDRGSRWTGQIFPRSDQGLGASEEFDRLAEMLRPHYKAILRRLIHNLPQSQRAQVNDLCRADGRDRRYQEYKDTYGTDSIAPAVFALVSWRMLWERADSPGKLLGRLVERPCAQAPHGFRKYRVRGWERAMAEQFVEFYRVDWGQSLDSESRLRIDERVFAAVCVESYRQISGQYDQARRESGKVAWQDFRLDPAGAPMCFLQIQPASVNLQWFCRPDA